MVWLPEKERARKTGAGFFAAGKYRSRCSLGPEPKEMVTSLRTARPPSAWRSTPWTSKLRFVGFAGAAPEHLRAVDFEDLLPSRGPGFGVAHAGQHVGKGVRRNLGLVVNYVRALLGEARGQRQEKKSGTSHMRRL